MKTSSALVGKSGRSNSIYYSCDYFVPLIYIFYIYSLFLYIYKRYIFRLWLSDLLGTVYIESSIPNKQLK